MGVQAFQGEGKNEVPLPEGERRKRESFSLAEEGEMKSRTINFSFKFNGLFVHIISRKANLNAQRSIILGNQTYQQLILTDFSLRSLFISVVF